jgi:ZIP family zinc transporter
VLIAIGFGFAAAATLLVGAALALARPWPRRAIGLVAGFGVGALISALTLDLTQSAFEEAGTTAVVVGLAAGAIAYTAGNLALQRATSTGRRKGSGGHDPGTGALGIVLGAAMDGIPESLVIGITLLRGESEGAAFFLAVAISNLPEGISATTGLARSGWAARRIYGLWLLVVGVSTLSAAIGYGALGTAPIAVQATIEAFAAGAILTMLADTMMPEAFEEAGPAVGLATVLGYALGALLTLV